MVGAHPWVYAAKLPNFGYHPILPQIFADMSYAGFDGIEVIHTALNSGDAVERIAELSHKHRLAVIGMSLAAGGIASTQAILEGCRSAQLAKLGGTELVVVFTR